MKTAILLNILELYMIPNFEFVQSSRMDLQDIFRRLAGDVSGNPGTRQNGIHNHISGVDPDDRQVREDKQHMDGSVNAAVTPFDKKQTFVGGKTGTEHQTAQTAKETVTVDSSQRRGKNLVFIFDANGFHTQ